jgi:hypothetical protein
MKIISIIFVASLLIMSTSINPATINFTGTLGFIENDTGSTTYFRLSIGDSLSGSFNFEDSASDAISIVTNPPVSSDYYFTGVPYKGAITDGAI